MANKEQEQPLTFMYDKDKQTVEVPIKAWQTLNQAAERLRDIAMFVSTMELVGQQHIADGTLRPVFKKDTEPVLQEVTLPDGTKRLQQVIGPDGQPQIKVRDSFWSKEKSVEKPTQVVADGKVIYDSTGVPVTSEDKTVVPESTVV